MTQLIIALLVITILIVFSLYRRTRDLYEAERSLRESNEVYHGAISDQERAAWKSSEELTRMINHETQEWRRIERERKQ